MGASSPPPVDPQVLGKILLLQTTMHAIPSPESVADFLCRGLEEMPGSTGVAIRFHDIVRASRPALVAKLMPDDGASSPAPQEGRSVPPEIRPAEQQVGGIVQFGIQTIHRWYGIMLFEVRDAGALEPYQPFLESLANTIALTLENREHEDSLKKLNAELLRAKEGLEAVVQERTADLVRTNVALAREIEERKRFEQDLRQAQKMEAIGTLAGGIAHDFNNILSAIVGYTELAKMHLSGNPEVFGHLEEVTKAGQRASELVRQILTFSRRAGEEQKPLLMQPVMKEALKFLRASIPTSIEIVEEISLETPQVMADPTQIHQVIMNLCTNAYHAMFPAGGVLRVSLAPVTLDGKDLSPGHPLSPGAYARLEVSDTGCGMDPQTMERIFDPYFTTKEKGRGTGLGLSMVHGIVQSLHGHIRVTSEPARGSAFQVYLPATRTADAPRERNEETPPLRGNERIWVIDDERSIALMEKELLASLGYRVRAFTSSADMLQAFQEQPDGCDLVFSDVGMPKMNGVELAKSVLAVRPDLPVILCTGFSDVMNRDQALALGVRDYIMKPLELEQLGRTVRAALDGQ